MSKKIAVVVTAVVFLVAVVIFLSPKTKPSNVRPTVSIGMVTFPGYAPLYLAKEKNLFPDINVNLVRIESIGDLRAAMNSGQIDMYAATYDIFQAADKDAPGVGFMSVDESHGADGIVASSGINSLRDLKGKTVGSEPGFPAYFILQYGRYPKTCTASLGYNGYRKEHYLCPKDTPISVVKLSNRF